MRMLEPDIGEVLDRMSILQLKIDAGMKRAAATEGWDEELRQLDVYLQKKITKWQAVATSSSTEDLGSLNARLCIVNQKLWDAEDAIRTYHKIAMSLTAAQTNEVVALALRIADLNDVRADLVRGINGLFGVTTREKL